MIGSTGQEGLQFISKVAEFLPLILYVYDISQDKIIFSNRLADQLMGDEKTALYAENGFFFRGLQASDRTSFTEFLNQCQSAADDAAVEMDYRLKHHESMSWFHHRAIVFSRMEDGSARLILNLAEDITDRKQNEENLLRFSTALKMTSDCVLITNLSNEILDANDSALKLYGCKAKQDLIGRDWFDFVAADDRESAAEGMRKVLMNGYMRNQELRIQSGENTEPTTVEISISIINNASRAFVGLVIIARDITERKKTEEKLLFISSYDSLTRVYNRFSFEEKLLQVENGDTAPVSVLMIDADGLKKVNDSLGHSVGDEMLVAVANVLKNSFRSNDFVARIGGDEFVVILPGAGSTDMDRTINRLKSNFDAAGAQYPNFKLSVSLGGYTAEKCELIRQALFYADERMYSEKLKKKAGPD
jgi:diguanylate cyclase (GGDEF)-like protein/PAS domain S-box-containing protein